LQTTALFDKIFYIKAISNKFKNMRWAMPKYKVTTTFQFNGYFIIDCETADESKKMVNEDCGLVLGGNIHTTLPDEQVDWKFDVHPERLIGQITKVDK